MLHCWVEVKDGRLARVEEKTFAPTDINQVSANLTKYTYTDTWKRDLSPEISKDQKPFFVLPDTGEVVKTTLQPVRGKVDKPMISGQEASNPFNTVFARGFSLNVAIPVVGGTLSLNLPFDRYLPKISVVPTGYVAITFGSSVLKDPADATLWKNREAEAYDKSMKEFQHDMSLARKKQAMGTAKEYYKKLTDPTGQVRVKLDFGYFMMFAGRGQFDEDSGGSVWSLSGATGAELVFSMEYTKPFTFPAPPIPMYFNIAFTASVGLGAEGLYFSFFVDDDMNLRNFEWSLVHGLTINVRLTLTVTFGVGIKGLCSAWIAASGGLNVIVQILVAQPAHIAVYGEFFLSVGFELLWIKHSRELWRSPYWMIYSNYEIKSEADSGLFAAYADAPDTDAVEETPLEPGRYPALAPQAKKVLSDVSDAHAGIRVATSQGRAFAFYLADAYSEIDRKSYRRVLLGER